MTRGNFYLLSRTASDTHRTRTGTVIGEAEGTGISEQGENVELDVFPQDQVVKDVEKPFSTVVDTVEQKELSESVTLHMSGRDLDTFSADTQIIPSATVLLDGFPLSSEQKKGIVLVLSSLDEAEQREVLQSLERRFRASNPPEPGTSST